MVNQTNNATHSAQSSDMSFYIIILAMIVAMAFYISSDIKQRYGSPVESSVQQIETSKSVVVSVEKIEQKVSQQQLNQQLLSLITESQKISNKPAITEVLQTAEKVAPLLVTEARTEVLHSVPAISIPVFKPVPVYGSYQAEHQPPSQEKEPCREQQYEQYGHSYQTYPKVAPKAQFSDPYHDYQSFQNKEKYYQLRQQNYQRPQYQEQGYQLRQQNYQHPQYQEQAYQLRQQNYQGSQYRVQQQLPQQNYQYSPYQEYQLQQQQYRSKYREQQHQSYQPY